MERTGIGQRGHGTDRRSTGRARERSRSWLCGLIVLGCVVMATGCNGVGDLLAMRDRAAELRTQTAQQADTLRDQLDTLPADDPVRGEVAQQLAEAEAATASLDAAIARIDQVAAEAQHPTDPIGQVVGLVAPWIPAPVRAPLILGGALVGVGLRARQLRSGMVSIIKSLDRAMKDDEQFANKFKEHAGTFRALQTPLAQRIVDATASGGRSRGERARA